VPAGLRDWIELGVLAAIVGLGWVRSADLELLVASARATRSAVDSEADFYAAPQVLGPEAPILEALERDQPAGAAVAVEGHGESVARAQRFWLALLPRHPIVGDAALLVCPRPCARPGDVELARGREFVLLDRSGRR
jgi:hypothetical protein